MRNTQRFNARLESLEGKTLLSTVPFLSQNTFNQVVHRIDLAAGTYAKTQNAAAFDAALASISYSIPYGHSQLYPTWQGDEGIYSPLVARSGVHMVSQIKADLKDYVQSAVVAGTIRVSGNWLGVTNPFIPSTTTVFVPVLSMKTYSSVIAQIDRAAGTYAKTHNAAGFDAALSNISYAIPYGHSQLYPTWQGDEGIYSPAVPGSGVNMINQIKADLNTYVQTAVASGTIKLR